MRTMPRLIRSSKRSGGRLFSKSCGATRPGADAGTPRLLRSDRPNVVLILLESFGRTIMDETVNGEPVMPNMQRFKREGVWFENFFANSFRTDRGQVAVLCWISGPNDHVDHEAAAKKRHAAFAGPVLSAGKVIVRYSCTAAT